MVSSNYYIQDNSDIETKKLEAARGLYKSGNYSAALKLYLDLVNTSYSYLLYYDIGRCYYKLNDIDNAIIYFSRSIELETAKNPSYVFLGSIYQKTQETQKAIENWITYFSYKPDDESVCLNLATSYFSKDMKFQSIFYYDKYLNYAKDKTANYYNEIKKSIETFIQQGKEFYQKANKALLDNDKTTAIQALDLAVRSYPTSFDINFLLGKLYFEEKEYMKSLIYLKQAYCIDSKSLDVLQLLSTVMINLGDFTGAYCCLKRILPLVLNNQKEYLEIMKSIKPLEESFDSESYKGHLEWGNDYYNENNYHFALFEYENCLIINGTLNNKLSTKISKLKSYLYPEERIIKTCLDRGSLYYTNGDYKESNKYFSKVLMFSKINTPEYRLAKSRIVNV